MRCKLDFSLRKYRSYIRKNLACNLTSPRWLWGGPSLRRADGTPIINKQYDTTRLINFYLRMLTLVKLLMSLELQRPKLWAVYLPTSLLIYICTSLSHPSIQTLPSCQAASSLNIHTQSRTATKHYTRSGVIIICQSSWSTRSIDLKRLLILLRAIEIAKSSDFIRRIWMIEYPHHRG